jgi:hypothetical protein
MDPSSFVTKEYIIDRLKNYEKVNNVKGINPGEWIQYLDVSNNEIKYRTGGMVVVNKNPDYLVVSNGSIKWSVQIENKVFYRMQNIDNVVAEYENKLEAKDRKISELKNLIKKLKKNNT